jgi:glycosyltransferase involved in cell wall biosynthesis
MPVAYSFGLELSIVMPCLNEAATLKSCISKAKDFMRSNNVAGEIIVADNGSTDDSQAIALSSGAKVIDVQTSGYGAALTGGIAASNYRVHRAAAYH